MTRQLVFVHGRAQEHKDAVALKAEWVNAWVDGLRKSGLVMPIAESDIRFPYYGQTLYDLVAGMEGERVAEIIVRGDNAEAEQKEFIRSVLEEVRKAKKIDESRLREVAGDDVVERGPLNWGWLQGILKAVDRYVPGSSGASIAIATNDVYQYLRNPGIRDTLEEGVRKAVSPDTQTVVVSHSLGTVVAYNLLRREGMSLRWNIPLLVTLGSPLGVTAIRSSLRPIKHPECVAKWFNAMDERDVVALYPLTRGNFDIEPEIENKTDVDNHTTNRHGISGYLNDKAVAKRIYDALIA
jgi:hypothetical protein